MYYRFYKKWGLSQAPNWTTGIWKRTREKRKRTWRVREGNVQGEWCTLWYNTCDIYCDGAIVIVLSCLYMQLTLHSLHPEKKIHMQESFAVHKDKSLREATQEAHKVRYDVALIG